MKKGLFLALFFSFHAIFGQIQVVEVASSPLSPDKLGPCEPSIALSMTDPQNLVIGSILDRFHYSFDGGKSWTSGKLKSTYGVWGDPVVISDTNGHFHYFHLSDPSGKNWESDSILDRIVCQTSTDGGKSWNNGSYMGLNYPKQQDKEWATVDPQNNTIYCTWTQFDKYKSPLPEDESHIRFSKSTDGGKNWADAISISQKGGGCMDNSETAEGAVPAVGPNGELYVSWSRNDTIWFTSSKDQGKTWEKEKAAALQPGGWSFALPGIRRCNGMPVTIVDRSNGPFRGTIYINWSDQQAGNDQTDIWVTSSTDGGKTWNKAQQINQDEGPHHQFFTWMTIDQKTGYLYAVYYDRRAYDDEQTDVYVAWSKDGGISWIEQKISEKPFIPRGDFFFGDYNHIVAHNGRIYPVWTAMEKNRLVVYTALLTQELLDKL